jgi:hypothetical protein
VKLGRGEEKMRGIAKEAIVSRPAALVFLAEDLAGDQAVEWTGFSTISTANGTDVVERSLWAFSAVRDGQIELRRPGPA